MIFHLKMSTVIFVLIREVTIEGYMHPADVVRRLRVVTNVNRYVSRLTILRIFCKKKSLTSTDGRYSALTGNVIPQTLMRYAHTYVGSPQR